MGRQEQGQIKGKGKNNGKDASNNVEMEGGSLAAKPAMTPPGELPPTAQTTAGQVQQKWQHLEAQKEQKTMFSSRGSELSQM